MLTHISILTVSYNFDFVSKQWLIFYKVINFFKSWLISNAESGQNFGLLCRNFDFLFWLSPMWTYHLKCEGKYWWLFMHVYSTVFFLLLKLNTKMSSLVPKFLLFPFLWKLSCFSFYSCRRKPDDSSLFR